MTLVRFMLPAGLMILGGVAVFLGGVVLISAVTAGQITLQWG